MADVFKPWIIRTAILTEVWAKWQIASKNLSKPKNGRTVYDGGGIEPDIEVKNEALKTVTNALINQNLIFHFATEYALKHEKITAARSFKVSDEIYKEFKSLCFIQKF